MGIKSMICKYTRWSEIYDDYFTRASKQI